jgi:hypothetical protein
MCRSEKGRYVQYSTVYVYLVRVRVHVGLKKIARVEKVLGTCGFVGKPEIHSFIRVFIQDRKRTFANNKNLLILVPSH